jgi:hypothetical protein
VGRAFPVPIELVMVDDTPPNPPAGAIKVYAKDDGKAYKLLPDGTESELGSGGGGGAAVPTLVSVGEIFHVPLNTQVLYSLPIVNDGGDIDIEGYLVHVQGATP